MAKKSKKAEILAKHGFSNTPEGERAFYEMFPTEDSYKKAFGGVPHNNEYIVPEIFYQAGGANIYTEKKMNPQQWDQFNKQRGFAPMLQNVGQQKSNNPAAGNQYQSYYDPTKGAPKLDPGSSQYKYSPGQLHDYGYKEPIQQSPQRTGYIPFGQDTTGPKGYTKAGDTSGQQYEFRGGDYHPIQQPVMAGDPMKQPVQATFNSGGISFVEPNIYPMQMGGDPSISSITEMPDIKTTFKHIVQKKFGGNQLPQGKDPQSVGKERTGTLLKYIQNNTINAIANEEAEAAQQYMQMGGLPGYNPFQSQDMNYFGYNPNMHNQNMFNQNAMQGQNGMMNNFSNFAGATSNFLGSQYYAQDGGGMSEYKDEGPHVDKYKQYLALQKEFGDRGKQPSHGDPYFPMNYRSKMTVDPSQLSNFMRQYNQGDNKLTNVSVTPEYGLLGRVAPRLFGPKKINYSLGYNGYTGSQQDQNQRPATSIPNKSESSQSWEQRWNKDTREEMNKGNNPDRDVPKRLLHDKSNYPDFYKKIRRDSRDTIPVEHRPGAYDPNYDGPDAQGFEGNPDVNSDMAFPMKAYGGMYNYGGIPYAQAGINVGVNPGNDWQQAASYFKQPGLNSSSVSKDPTKIQDNPFTPITSGMSSDQLNQGKQKDPFGLDLTASRHYDQEAGVNWGIAGANALGSVFDFKNNQQELQKYKSLQGADAQFYAAGAGNRGDYDVNSGMFRPNQHVPVQNPGYNSGNIGSPYMSQYGSFMQDGGTPGNYDEGDEAYMSQDEIDEFLRNGGQIDYLD